ncbi:hypothetical protein [Mammaliicoccus sciuri]|uniref:hypothetical protein n=1 Tax=Mammaliicoccus sciuri TaxID=1296 RepID=UPI0013050202|nr:hypothetical protein [Mammaliicoccus sciuri]
MAQDRRNRKTQNAIKEIFLNLLQKYSFYDITVQQIADIADINRFLSSTSDAADY